MATSLGKETEQLLKELSKHIYNGDTTLVDRRVLRSIAQDLMRGVHKGIGKRTIDWDNPDTDIQVYGFTDNTGSMAANEKVSNGRAQSVQNYLVSNGVAANRLTAKGLPMDYYIADNATAEGRAQNRRVEIYITANEDMIKKANDGTL